MATSLQTRREVVAAYRDGEAIPDIAARFSLKRKQILPILINEIGYAAIRESNRAEREKASRALKGDIERALTLGMQNPEILTVADMAKTIGMRADVFPRVCVKFKLDDELRKVKELFKERRKS